MMMMTVCWMERMTALESPDVAGGRYVTRGGGEDLFAGAAADLPFTPRTSGHIAKIVCSHSPTVQQTHVTFCVAVSHGRGGVLQLGRRRGDRGRHGRVRSVGRRLRRGGIRRGRRSLAARRLGRLVHHGLQLELLQHAEKVVTSIVGRPRTSFQHACLEWAEEFARSLLSSAVAVGSSLASESTTRTADCCRGMNNVGKVMFPES